MSDMDSRDNGNPMTRRTSLVALTALALGCAGEDTTEQNTTDRTDQPDRGLPGQPTLDADAALLISSDMDRALTKYGGFGQRRAHRYARADVDFRNGTFTAIAERIRPGKGNEAQAVMDEATVQSRSYLRDDLAPIERALQGAKAIDQIYGLWPSEQVSEERVNRQAVTPEQWRRNIKGREEIDLEMLLAYRVFERCAGFRFEFPQQIVGPESSARDSEYRFHFRPQKSDLMHASMQNREFLITVPGSLLRDGASQTEGIVGAYLVCAAALMRPATMRDLGVQITEP